MRRLGALAGAQIVAVCDVVADLADGAAQLTGARPYTDYRALLERPDLDAVYLSIPVFAHGEPELAVIERGLPMLVEKPVALDLDTARGVLAAVRRAGVLTCVGYQLRYCGSADAARERLAAPDTGPIGTAAGTYWCGTGRAPADHWRNSMRRSGGQLVEQATHTVDMMRFLVGEIGEVFAYYGRRVIPEGHGDCPDVHAVALRFASGATGTLNATWAIDPTDWGHANLVDVAAGEQRLHWRITGLSVVKGAEREEIARPDQSIDEVFVDAVRTGDASAIRSDYADAVRSLAVSLAANQSAAAGAPVPVPQVG
jgi:predicted dehydrogenase